MKKKLLSIIMILVVLAIWIVIIFRVYGTIGGNNIESLNLEIQYPGMKKNEMNYLDSFQLFLDYSDPFIKKKNNENYKRDHSKIHGAKINNPTKRPRKKSDSKIKFPSVRYIGNMINSTNGRIKAILIIDGKEYLVKTGEVINDLKVTDVKKTEVSIMLKSVNKIFLLEK